MNLKTPKEGEYLETVEGVVFGVKGIIHPPTHIIAFPKYVPNGKERKGYRKLDSLESSYKFLQENYPEYLRHDPVFNEVLGEVPKTKVKKIFSPQETLQNLLKKEKLDEVEKDCIDFVKLLGEYSSIPLLKLGVSGSVMLGLHTKDSDIDIVVYGENLCFLVYQALKKMVKEETSVKQYTEKDLLRLYSFRVKDTFMSFNQFVKTETRKVLQGRFRQREYFVRLVKEPWEIGEKYGEKYYVPMGFVELEAEVTEDREAIFTPVRYPLRNVSVMKGADDVDVREVVSFRGRFCEQAKKFEKIFVRGKLEKVLSIRGEYCRVLVGARKEDVLIPLD